MLQEAYQEVKNELALPDEATGEVPKNRLKDAEAQRTIWRKLERDDEPGSFNRSTVRGLGNGEPPFEQTEREEEGLGSLCNVNTGRGRLILDQAAEGVMDLFNTDKNLLEIPLSTKIPLTDRSNWQGKMEFRFTEMLRNWDAFGPRIHNLAFTFVTDGIAVALKEEETSWKIMTAGLSDIKFPRRCEPVASLIPVACMKRNLHAGELWRKVGNEKESKGKGWNRDEVIKALGEAGKNADHSRWRNWEKLEEDLKANDAYCNATIPPIPLLYMWVEEFDGQVSFYVCAENGGEFLQERSRVYKDMGRALQVFPYSTGTNNRLYTVRGLGHAIFQPCNMENIMWSDLMNAAKVNSMPSYSMRGTEEMEDASLADVGFGFVSGPGLSLDDKQQGRNLTQSMIPAMNLIDSTLQRNSGGLGEGPMEFGERQNKDGISATLQTLSSVTSAIGLFMPPLDCTFREMVRAIFFDNADTKESTEMKRLLVEEDGVPEEVFALIDIGQVRARRVVGAGNKAARMNVISTTREKLYPSLDAQGRKSADFSLAQEMAGTQIAHEWVGLPEATRSHPDEWRAEVENELMMDGSQMEPKDGQDHLVHLTAHVNLLLEDKDAVENGDMLLEDYVTRYLPIWVHSQKTLDMMSVDATLQPLANDLKAQVQRLREYFWNGLRKINEGGAEGQQAEGQEQGEENPEDNEERRKNEAFLNEERRKAFAFDADQTRKVQMHQVNIAAKDAETAAKIKRGK